MASKKTPPRRHVVNFKDVQIAYLLDGIGGVEKLLGGRKTAPALLRRALRELKAQGRSVEALENYVNERHGSGTRGRAAPTVGDERKYKAQQIGDGGSFLRLPLAPLGVKKSGVVRVRFEADRIVVLKG